MKSPLRSPRLLAPLITCALSLAACGKQVDVADRLPSTADNPSGIPTNPNDTGPTTPQPGACAAADRIHWRFTQPDPVVSGSVDLLFVVDTSSSLAAERSGLAEHLPDFLSELDPRTDYRISVMLGHGGASASSGKLYSASGVSKVLSSQTQSLGAIRSGLRATLADPPADQDEANGEMMMYSLARGLEPSRLSSIRSAGFLRDDAALSVIFVSDENDACYPPELHGFTAFPDFVASISGWERVAYDRYCKDARGVDRITPSSLLGSLRSLKHDRKLSIAGVIHSEPARVPPASSTSEDAIGHGILELAQAASDHVVMDIASPSYAAGLARLGDVVSSQLNLETLFSLNGRRVLESTSLKTTVDGTVVPATFDSVTREVRIRATDAGQARSVVDVSACPRL